MTAPKETLEAKAKRLLVHVDVADAPKSWLLPDGTAVWSSDYRHRHHAEVALSITGKKPELIWEDRTRFLDRGWVRVLMYGSSWLNLEWRKPMTYAQRETLLTEAGRVERITMDGPGGSTSEADVHESKSRMAAALRMAEDGGGASRLRALRHHSNALIARRHRR